MKYFHKIKWLVVIIYLIFEIYKAYVVNPPVWMNIVTMLLLLCAFVCIVVACYDEVRKLENKNDENHKDFKE